MAVHLGGWLPLSDPLSPSESCPPIYGMYLTPPKAPKGYIPLAHQPNIQNLAI